MELILKRLVERPELFFPRNEIVSRRDDGTLFRYTYREFGQRVRRLSSAFATLGLKPGDRVASFAWNNFRHLELYFAVPCFGAVLHTANIRLSPEHIAYTINHARDALVFLTPDLIPVMESVAPLLKTVRGFVVMDEHIPETTLAPIYSYEALLAAGDAKHEYPEFSEHTAAAICFTSATTGNPKGVVYSHRAIYLHSLMLGNVDTLAICERDALLPISPMFHVNAWGIPFAGVWMGSKIILPGMRPVARDNLALIQSERATFVAGAVTVGIDMMRELEQQRYDLSSLRALMLGGQATPKAVMEYYWREHRVPIFTAWGSTECAPIATTVHIKRDQIDLPEDAKMDIRVRQGLPVPGVEMKVLNDEARPVAWNDREAGEAYVRGPWIATEYLDDPRSGEGFVDGWWKSGDVAMVNDDGVLRLVDRAKDLIKSGGEWISSIDLENALMAHPQVAEAVVVAIPHEKWVERPVAFVVPAKDAAGFDTARLNDHLLARGFAKWWLPDRFIVIDEIPKTGVGKFDKKRLRERIRSLSETALLS